MHHAFCLRRVSRKVCYMIVMERADGSVNTSMTRTETLMSAVCRAGGDGTFHSLEDMIHQSHGIECQISDLTLTWSCPFDHLRPASARNLGESSAQIPRASDVRFIVQADCRPLSSVEPFVGLPYGTGVPRSASLRMC